MTRRNRTIAWGVSGLVLVIATAGCSHGSHHDAASSAASSSSQVTVSGTPQSQWPTTASRDGEPDPNGTPTTSFAHTPSVAQQQTPKKFMDAYLHTDGVSQDAWAKGVGALSGPQFGGWLVSQGLERLPHHQHVQGSPRLIDVNPDQPEAKWSVAVKDQKGTDVGTYVLTQDLSSPEGKIQNMTYSPGPNVPTDPD